jgi:hypothetical protein
LHMNNMLGVWTGPDDATIRRRMAAGAFRVPRRAPLAEAVDREPDARAVLAADQGSSRFGNKGRGAFGFALPAAGLAGYVLLVGVYFLRGASWASSSPAPEGLAPVGVAELRTRLEALSDVDVPFVIEATADPEELIAIWRYGDARWFGPGRVHGSGRAHRIKLRLDAASHIVYASDYTAEYRWSAGGSGAQLQWKAARGITFFHRERRRTFGVEVDSCGRPKLQSSYSYTFDVLEMKSPLIDVVSRSGWTWRPVVWQGPKWLAWLTG